MACSLRCIWPLISRRIVDLWPTGGWPCIYMVRTCLFAHDLAPGKRRLSAHSFDIRNIECYAKCWRTFGKQSPYTMVSAVYSCCYVHWRPFTERKLHRDLVKNVLVSGERMLLLTVDVASEVGFLFFSTGQWQSASTSDLCWGFPSSRWSTRRNKVKRAPCYKLPTHYYCLEWGTFQETKSFLVDLQNTVLGQSMRYEFNRSSESPNDLTVSITR